MYNRRNVRVQIEKVATHVRELDEFEDCMLDLNSRPMPTLTVFRKSSVKKSKK